MGPKAAPLVLASGLFLFAGFALVLWSLRHQDGANPLRPTLRPRAWRPVWLQRDHFATEEDFSRYVLGIGLVAAGAMISLIQALLA